MTDWKYRTLLATVLAVGLACARPPEAHNAGADLTPAAAANAVQAIDHLTPRRDSIGGVPAYFEWTPAPGADRYAIGVWSEVDVLIWRRDNIPEPRVAWPKEMPLEPGTYYWSVTALDGDRVLADSGRAAFIVRLP